jgi:hypothetical protein
MRDSKQAEIVEVGLVGEKVFVGFSDDQVALLSGEEVLKCMAERNRLDHSLAERRNAPAA